MMVHREWNQNNAGLWRLEETSLNSEKNGLWQIEKYFRLMPIGAY
jgi:hypothetical protein